MQGKTAVTHRIIGIETDENGNLLYETKGDANNTADMSKVSEKALIGVFKGRLPQVGSFALFLQTPLGMILFVGVPLAAFIVYDIIRRQKAANRENKKTAALQAEVERLRALANEAEQSDP